MTFIDWARLGMGSSVNLEHMAHIYLLQKSLSSAPAESAAPISQLQWTLVSPICWAFCAYTVTAALGTCKSMTVCQHDSKATLQWKLQRICLLLFATGFQVMPLLAVRNKHEVCLDATQVAVS